MSLQSSFQDFVLLDAKVPDIDGKAAGVVFFFNEVFDVHSNHFQKAYCW